VAEKQVVRRQPNAIQRFYRETVGELRKVSWPTRREAANLTLIVLIVVVFMVLVLGSLDLFFSWLLSLLVGV
jgi:preprotein translocase subunit SecE